MAGREGRCDGDNQKPNGAALRHLQRCPEPAYMTGWREPGQLVGGDQGRPGRRSRYQEVNQSRGVATPSLVSYRVYRNGGTSNRLSGPERVRSTCSGLRLSVDPPDQSFPGSSGPGAELGERPRRNRLGGARRRSSSAQSRRASLRSERPDHCGQPQTCDFGPPCIPFVPVKGSWRPASTPRSISAAEQVLWASRCFSRRPLQIDTLLPSRSDAKGVPGR